MHAATQIHITYFLWRILQMEMLPLYKCFKMYYHMEPNDVQTFPFFGE